MKLFVGYPVEMTRKDRGRYQERKITIKRRETKTGQSIAERVAEVWGVLLGECRRENFSGVLRYHAPLGSDLLVDVGF